jgi:hypothetical protein
MIKREAEILTRIILVSSFKMKKLEVKKSLILIPSMTNQDLT